MGEGDAATEKTIHVIYGYRVRLTDEKFRSRNLLAANYQVADGAATYANDSDLVYLTGELMAVDADGNPTEFAVLLNVADEPASESDGGYVASDLNTVDNAAAGTKVSVASQPSNLVTAKNSNNTNQDENDRYNRVPTRVVPTFDFTYLDGAGAPRLRRASWLASARTSRPRTARWRPTSGRRRLPTTWAKGASRANNDAGLMEIPRSKISGYLFHDANYNGVFDANDASFTVDGTTYTERGINGKTVTLKTWYFVPGAHSIEGETTRTVDGGVWVLADNTPVADAGDEAGEEETAEVAELLQALEQSEIDVAFAILNPSEPAVGQVHSLPLLQSEICAAVHVDNPLARRDAIELEQLADQTLITPNQDFNLSGIILSPFVQPGDFLPGTEYLQPDRLLFGAGK